MKAFYRGSIRSGFVSHSDEDDPQVLARIQEQALRDADWLIAKVRRACSAACLGSAAALLCPWLDAAAASTWLCFADRPACPPALPPVQYQDQKPPQRRK